MIETNEKNPKPPCIGELRKKRFFVPFYQRGYRWEAPQVKLLLEDIKENTEGARKYSLQPIVVASRNAEEGERWELIDGQQRLTTLNLFLLALGEETIPIQYARQQGEEDETSDRPGLEITQRLQNSITSKEEWGKLKENEHLLDTVDNHHIVEAWLAIKTWLGAPVPGDHFMKPAVLCRTTVIWHEVGSENAASEFLRYNTGKIHLSPCELLKARFLATFDPPMKHRSPAEIAAEWDQMESAFHSEEFWSFLNPPKHVSDAPNRIALLFELLHPSDKDSAAGKGYFESFPSPNEIVKIEDEWLEVRRCFLTLQEWFADREIRKLVGFLRWAKTSTLKIELGDFWEAFETGGRIGYADWLMENVKNVVSPQGQLDHWEKASFEEPNDRHYLQDTLFWFNIRTLPPGTDYPFARHASVSTWSLEHIHAQSSPEEANAKQFEEWKKGCSTLLEHLKKKWADTETRNLSADTKKLEELVGQIKGLTLEESAGPETLKLIRQNARQLDDALKNLLPNPIGEDLNKIWNLALLGRDENSSLSNGFFHQKREKVLKFEREVDEQNKPKHFVPPATVRVFLKAHSSEPDDLFLWAPEDRDGYKDRIREVLEASIKKGASQP